MVCDCFFLRRTRPPESLTLGAAMGQVNTRGIGQDEPLVVSPARAKAILDCGTTRLYELIAAGELDRDGKSRKITVASIKARIARKLAESRTEAA
jgi:hypothetical protein